MNATPKKKKIYFNFIDLILIIVILGSIASLVFFLRERRILTKTPDRSEEIVYKLEVSPLREEFRNLADVGNSVIDTVGMNVIGEITDVSYSPCYYHGTDPDTGLSVSTVYPGRVTMTLTIKATASKSDTGYAVGGRELILGEALSFRVPDFTGSGICVSIQASSPAGEN